MSVRYLGADLPVQDWADAVLRTGARAVVIGVVVRADVRAALDVARSAREASASVVVAFGGRRASAVPADDVHDAIVLPDDMTGAVATLREELAGPR